MKLLLALMLTINTMALKLESGDDFYSGLLQGAVGITCDNGMNYQVKMYMCKKEQLFPAMEDHIISDNPQATKVEVHFVDRKGKKRSKTLKFDSTLGRTKRKVSLWKSNLWNRPLLKIGKNMVEFRAYNGRELLETQIREINVEDVGQGSCGSATIKSKDMQDCYSMSRACELLFKVQNYCRASLY